MTSKARPRSGEASAETSRNIVQGIWPSSREAWKVVSNSGTSSGKQYRGAYAIAPTTKAPRTGRLRITSFREARKLVTGSSYVPPVPSAAVARPARNARPDLAGFVNDLARGRTLQPDRRRLPAVVGARAGAGVAAPGRSARPDRSRPARRRGPRRPGRRLRDRQLAPRGRSTLARRPAGRPGCFGRDAGTGRARGREAAGRRPGACRLHRIQFRLAALRRSILRPRHDGLHAPAGPEPAPRPGGIPARPSTRRHRCHSRLADGIRAVRPRGRARGGPVRRGHRPAAAPRSQVGALPVRRSRGHGVQRAGFRGVAPREETLDHTWTREDFAAYRETTRDRDLFEGLEPGARNRALLALERGCGR